MRFLTLVALTLMDLILGFFGWFFTNAVPDARKGDQSAIAVVVVVLIVVVIFGIVCSI